MNKAKFLVYCYTCKCNGKQYIGQTCRSLEERAGNNGYYYIKNCPYFANAIKKYGWGNFTVQILKNDLTVEEANYWESYFIKSLHTCIEDEQCHGYNGNWGGGNHHLTEATKQKITEKINSPITKNIIREKCRQAALNMTEEHKHKISESKKGYHFSEEIKQKMSAVRKDKKKTRCVETGIIYDSLQDASNTTAINKANISRACRIGIRAGGFHWEYI